MNLLDTPWIKCVRLDKTTAVISPPQLTQGHHENNPIIDIVTDRPDFRGALYQFLIGLLQSIHPPATETEWKKQWDQPPSSEELEVRFKQMQHAFKLDTTGPAFMQDYDLPEGEPKPISALLIEAPGGKTLKDNLDHFIKRGQVNHICPACAGLALFTLQINAPSGGVGHRVGLRGGGPLTTLLLPDETQQVEGHDKTSLWHKLWLNVLPEDEFCRTFDDEDEFDWNGTDPAKIYPWLGPTRTSENKTGQKTLPEDTHPYQMYWGMPRRIRIDFKNLHEGTCDLCGASDSRLVKQFITKNYGTDYAETWPHALTPYARKNLTAIALPLHGQKGGVTYRHWLGLTLGSRDANQTPAETVRYFLTKRMRRLKSDRHCRIWAFGFDMDNMKARCWYDARMPLYDFEPSIREALKKLVSQAVDAASEMAANLRKEIKNARYKRPKDIKGDWSFIDIEFWQATETGFYRCLREGIAALQKKEDLQEVKKQFHSIVRRAAMSIFDSHAQGGPLRDMSVERVIVARRNLSIWLEKGKKVNELLGKKQPQKSDRRKNAK